MILAQKELFATENSDRFISSSLMHFEGIIFLSLLNFLNHPPTPCANGISLAHSNALHTVLPIEGDSHVW